MRLAIGFVLLLCGGIGCAVPSEEMTLEPGFRVVSDEIAFTPTETGEYELDSIRFNNSSGFREMRVAWGITPASAESFREMVGMDLMIKIYSQGDPVNSYFEVSKPYPSIDRGASIPLSDGVSTLKVFGKGGDAVPHHLTMVVNPRKESMFGRDLNQSDLTWFDQRYCNLHDNDGGQIRVYECQADRAPQEEHRGVFAFSHELEELFAENCQIQLDDGDETCIKTPADLAISINRGHFMWTLRMENIEPPKVEVHDGTATITSRKKMIGPKGGLGGPMEELERWKQVMTVEVQGGKIVATGMTMEMEGEVK